MKHIKQYGVRIISGGAMLIGLLVAVAQPAVAMSMVSIGSSATLATNEVVANLPVAVTCDAGDTAYLNTGIVEQVKGGSVAHGYGSVTLACTGSMQEMMVTVVAQDKAFRKGQALATVNVTDCSGFTCQYAAAQQGIELVKK